MGRVESHNSLNHGRIIRELVENGQFFEFFEIERVEEDSRSDKLTLVLVKKEVQGSGFVMRPAGRDGAQASEAASADRLAG